MGIYELFRLCQSAVIFACDFLKLLQPKIGPFADGKE